jgi:hypothetical protein
MPTPTMPAFDRARRLITSSNSTSNLAAWGSWVEAFKKLKIIMLNRKKTYKESRIMINQSTSSKTFQNHHRFWQIMDPKRVHGGPYIRTMRRSKGLRFQSPNIQGFGPTTEATGTINELHPSTFDANRLIISRYSWKMYYICMLQNVQSQKHVLDYMYLFYIKNKHTYIYICIWFIWFYTKRLSNEHMFVWK